jgi:hypothetical protein
MLPWVEKPSPSGDGVRHEKINEALLAAAERNVTVPRLQQLKKAMEDGKIDPKSLL